MLLAYYGGITSFSIKYKSYVNETQSKGLTPWLTRRLRSE